MKVEIIKRINLDAKYLEVIAGVRHWEDASVNGVEDTDGKLIPLRNGDNWEPIISLSAGMIVNWPSGTTANIHYKVCDQGEYWLLDENRQRIAKWSGYYVPDSLLCQNGDGFGDYIIMEVSADGKITGWSAPQSAEAGQWEAV